ncbi:TonB-dependent receptor plug domain-containing protein [uncultured Chitinophaga sp.]|uniref:TonB-dependent receptor plug domain-containing protein n=1 Tax=uncultured Chitinophaga sp. TaxID=339340 RepID=UPI002635F281|nr:TonB-dependent receptor plug domain-containing protein [uncultured Chitinophaga sp.]
MEHLHVKSTPESAARTNDIQTTKICKDIRMGNIAAILVYSFFTFTMIFSVAGPACAQEGTTPPQQTLPQEKTFTLSGTYSIEEIFDLMDKETGIYVNRSSKVIDFSQEVTVYFRKTPVAEVMDKVLGDRLVDWTYRGGNIILFRSQHPVRLNNGEQLITVTGMVMDNDGVALPGVTIMVKGEKKGGVTNGSGFYKIERVHPQSVLIINSIGFLSRQYRLDGEHTKNFILEPAVAQIEAVEVTANTGYQVLKKRETPGAYNVIDSTLINRAVSPNILDRLEGISGGILVSRTPGTINWFPKTPDGADNGFYIRGFNTISPNSVNPNPLIILDNFPYEGNITNINPNDIASMTILKDAGSTSIWGARSGNGVIVLTTKTGKYGEKMKINFNVSMSLGLKPKLHDDIHFIESKDYIEIERTLFSQGFYEQDINNTFNRPAITPVVSLLLRNRNGELNNLELENQLNQLKLNDVRRDFSEHAYRNSFGEQYSINIRGGTKDFSYFLSLGHDRARTKFVRNYQNRTNVVYNNIFKPAKNLEVNAYINYTQNNLQIGNNVAFRGVQSKNGRSGELYPYASFTDKQGNKVPVVKDYNTLFTDSLHRLGYLDWNYYPLDEISNNTNKNTLQNLILKASINYKFLRFFQASLSYQNQRQIINGNNYYSANSYFTRDLVNTFSSYNIATGRITQQLPAGGIMINGDYDWKANNVRGTLGVNRNIKSHGFRLLVGGEVRELDAEGSERAQAGYSDINGTPVTNLNTNILYPLTPVGQGKLNTFLDFDGSTSSFLSRYISYFSVLEYNWDQRLELNLIARRDGGNLFGARTNRKFSPFWAIAGGWSVDKEEFWNVDFVNRYYGSSYLTISRSPDVDPLTGLPTSVILNPPNEDLRWEKSKMLNIGSDFSLFQQHLEGSFDFFTKKSFDLIQRFDVAPQTGFSTVQLNSARTVTRGGELTLNGNWKFSRSVGWRPKLNISWISDKLLEYDQKPTRQSVILLDSRIGMVRLPGKSTKAMFSYKWAGLDAKTGDPQGYLNGEVSKNYTAMLNNFHTDSLVYHGSASPRIFGNVMNDITYKRWNLSVNLYYRFKYYFRKPGLPINYSDLLKGPHQDFSKSWRMAGDERYTNVPSVSVAYNDLRNQFYQRSEVLVEKADNIRLQDIRLSYTVTNTKEISKVKQIELYSYLSNVGIIWRANKLGLDPDLQYTAVLESYRIRPTISIGAILKL